MMRINMYGDGIRMYVCDLEQQLYTEMKKLKGGSYWEDLIFDLDRLKEIGMNHWSEMATQAEIIGLHVDHWSFVEIKKGVKRLIRFGADQFNVPALFPLYDLQWVKLSEEHPGKQRLLIVEFEKGLIQAYRLETEELRMDELQFELMEWDKTAYCTALNFNGERLISNPGDSVVIGVRVFE